MRNILIEIEYDGTAYSGWQIQPAVPTIQGEIQRALKQFSGTEILINGSGRTDAGVHAKGQTANFFLDNSIPAEKLPFALNGLLPADIAVRKAKEVEQDFHARFSAIGKVYSYQLYRGAMPSPLLSRYSDHIPGPLDLERMRAGAARLTGTHDFAAFMAKGSQVSSTVRTVYAIDIEEREDSVWLTFQGNGFLYNMVRIMVGTLVEVGRGRRESASISQALTVGRRELAGKTVPPQGLFLNKVIYPLTR